MKKTFFMLLLIILLIILIFVYKTYYEENPLNKPSKNESASTNILGKTDMTDFYITLSVIAVIVVLFIVLAFLKKY